ncbi:MAG: hypothetical protein H9W81_15065 [Enterococcus sp.]|nr:hypothetical protein [Enterococcus sp.]
MQFYLVDKKFNKVGRVTFLRKSVTVDTLDGRLNFDCWSDFLDYLSKSDYYAIKNL